MKRTGARLTDENKRVHTVSVRLNDAELAELDAKRGSVSMTKGQFMRVAALGRNPPRSIPEINHQAWSSLGRSAANLNQIAQRMNAQERLEIDEIRTALATFRRGLIGARDEVPDEG